ncbi:hypothetical protein AGOR_G00210420 [Albula goreensis]|uniref:Ig-like domain-containing protein n=1 Tax=Albula goreensis TaxID=1534307 RepID=A0A8T3CUA2_9TELE|nr:hypothetical protein AGOR_G00210420 [Albula goreensis]
MGRLSSFSRQQVKLLQSGREHQCNCREAGEMALSYCILLLFRLIFSWSTRCTAELDHYCTKRFTSEVSTALGGAAVLPCSFQGFSTETRCYRMKWGLYPSNKQSNTVLIWPKLPLVPDFVSLLGERATFQWGEEGVKVGNLSLSLREVEKTDSGTYTCEVWDGWQCLMAKNVTLKVKDCDVGKTIIGQPNTTVTLPCPLRNSTGRNTNITWYLVTGEHASLILQHPPSSSDPNSSRPLPLHGRARFSGNLDLREASLTVIELQTTDTNWYRCNVLMGEKHYCHEVRLHVKVTDSPVTVVTMTTDVNRLNVTANVEANKEDSGSQVFVILSALSVCAVAIVGAIAYMGYRKHINAAEEDLSHAYENIHTLTRDSVVLPTTLYSFAQCDQHVTQDSTSRGESH